MGLFCWRLRASLKLLNGCSSSASIVVTSLGYFSIWFLVREFISLSCSKLYIVSRSS